MSVIPEPPPHIGVDIGQRNLLAAHASMEIERAADVLAGERVMPEDWKEATATIAAMYDLIGDVGFEPEAAVGADLGGSMSLDRLRVWVRRWRDGARSALADHQRQLEVNELRQAEARDEDEDPALLHSEASARRDIAEVQGELAIWLTIEARIMEATR